MTPSEPRHLPDPNAFHFFRAAGEALVWGEKLRDATSRKDFPLEQKRDLLNANAAAILRRRDGLAFDCGNPLAEGDLLTWPHLWHFRYLAYLLRLEGQVRQADGDESGALASRLDCMRFGTLISRQTLLVGTLVSIAAQNIARADLWPTVRKLNGESAMLAAKRAEEALQLIASFREALLEDRRWSRKRLRNILDHPDWRSAAAEAIRSPIPVGVRAFFMRKCTKERIIEESERDWDEALERERYPYHAIPPEKPRRRTARCWGAYHVGIDTGIRLTYLNNRTQMSLLTGALALAAFRASRGKYPADLQDLVPDVLSAVPDDPFAPSCPLRYRAEGEDYVLYSVGPDGRDDGGKPIKGPVVVSERRRDLKGQPLVSHTFPGGPGDVVAGVNLI